jgi:tRNA (cmo5U34)-methyltransferase
VIGTPAISPIEPTSIPTSSRATASVAASRGTTRGGELGVTPDMTDSPVAARYVRAVGDVPWDPASYPTEIRKDIPRYDELQQRVGEATGDLCPDTILELGTGAGETASLLLALHPEARLLGIDSSAQMLAAARDALPADRVELHLAQLGDALPAGPFDLVVSALTVHHLSAQEKVDLFRRVAEVLRPGGRFVLGDVVLPDRPEDAVIPLEEGFDRPDSAEAQLDWLRALGLDAEVVWTRQDLAVLRGDRPR